VAGRALLAVLFPLLAALVLLTATLAGAAPTMNGFDLQGALVPESEIHFGGPPKDGIPAIDRPRFVEARASDFLDDRDMLLGIARDGVVRAYPVKILNWHEVVNDIVGGQPVVITYCPLCGTGVVFAAKVDGRTLTFGVSGLLYQSDVLLYDRETNSLWSQLLGQAISGPLKGSRLSMLAVTQTRWHDWRREHPQTQVLSTATGAARPYRRDPYAGYEQSEELYFPVELPDAFRRFGIHPKERVLGIRINGAAKAYPFSQLDRTGGRLHDRVGGRPVTIRFDAESQRATAHAESGEQLAGIVGYWFAWYAFNRDTEVYAVRP
jgi:hypothetical protein